MAADDAIVRRLARSSGLSIREIRRFVQVDIVTMPDAGAEPVVLRRLRKARRLRRDLGLSVDAIAIVLRLLDRIETLEAERLNESRG